MVEQGIGPLSEEQAMLLETIQKLAQDTVAPGAAERDLERTFPADVIEGIAELGLLGVPYPESVGGVEMGQFTHALVIEELARACAATAMTVVASTNLALGAVVLAGTPEQHEAWGAPLAMGEPLGALVLGAGELAPGPSADGVTAARIEGGWKLNGTADLVMNGGCAGTLVVLAATDPDSAAAGLFLVAGDAEGLERGEPVHTMGLRAMNQASLTFADVKVSDQNVLGDPAGGLALAQQALDHARVAMAAVSVGLGRAALEKALTFGKERIAFGRPIVSFGGSLEKVTAMASALEAARQLTYAAARAQDAGGEFIDLAAMAQIQAGRIAHDVGYEALQIMGGYGYCHEYDVERICRDAKMCEVGFDELAHVRASLAKRIAGL